MQKLAQEKNDTLRSKFHFAFPVFIYLLCLGSLAYYYGGNPSPLHLQEISEMIPDRAVVDTNGKSQLESTVYFIRQSFHTIPQFQLFASYVSYIISMLLGILLLSAGLRQWGQFSRIYSWGGFLTWAIVIYLTNSHAPRDQIYLILIEQIQILGILTLAASTLFISAAIPRLLFQWGQTNTPQQSRKNWLFMGGFYLINLGLCYGSAYLGWDIPLAIPGIIFFFLAWIAYTYQASPLNQLLRWGIAILSLGTIALFIGTGNDAGINALQHWTLICFLLMLFLFPLFIYSNFRSAISQHLPVYKIVHKAPHLDIRVMFVGVFILGSAWVFAKNGTVWHQFQAAFYNERGDIAWIQQDKQGAEFAYQQAMIHSKLNKKSNVSLAAMAMMVNDVETAAYYLSTANVKHADPVHFVALAGIYQQANKPFEALFALQQAHQKFPKSIVVHTQLARQFEMLHVADSATHYYAMAWQLEPETSLVTGNYLYASQKQLQGIDLHDDAIQANQIVLALKKGEKFQGSHPSLAANPGPDLRTWAMIYNYNLWAKSQAAIMPAAWGKDLEISHAFPEINLLAAWQDYHHGRCIQALQKINLLISADSTSKTAGLQQILGFWKESLLLPQTSPQIRNWKEAKSLLDRHPFQIDVLQQAIPILNQSKKEKFAYDAALTALQWNENLPAYYLIYAMQAYQIGEISYGTEAVVTLKKISPSTYEANKSVLLAAAKQAEQRQKFN